MSRASRLIALAAGLAVLWLLMSGHFEPMLLGFGLLSIALSMLVAHRLGATDDEGVPAALSLRALAYLPWLLKEIVKANIDVAKIILAPSLPISPTLLRVPASQKTDLGRVIYANSITLTPGTIAVELHSGDGTILVHALTSGGADSFDGGDMDRRCTAVEGRTG